MLGSSLVGSGFSKWLRRHFCISVFTCSFLPTTSSTDSLTSSLSTSKDWWRHFRNSEFVLRHSRYSCHCLCLKEPIHFVNQVIRIILQSGLPGLWKFFNGFDVISGLYQYQMSTSCLGVLLRKCHWTVTCATFSNIYKHSQLILITELELLCRSILLKKKKR